MENVTLYLLFQFAFVSSVTPGPNNLMLMASGANYGFRRTIPHMFGISLGHSFMVAMIGLILLRVFTAYPVLNTILTVLAVLYMSWLSWKIATAVPPEASQVKGKPFTFLQAAAFQWVNPKAWVMGITAITAFAPQDRPVWVGSLIVAGVFLLSNLPAITIWAALGVQVRRFLGTARRLRAFNVTMAALLMASLIPMIWH
ncbi:Threonine/homoserine/homoserine lactone efflux protein [Loktanella sp. DSM 29012]|uniref:LysE family translocator n=1 Tax=Loktanella sp. DSM 29012 TaxID=1881056 RepID=UPI0008D379BE|nr:LysE family translocator [Loktanella sp. DSM 29012]SEP96055.1 Threonine/homoserine/homoserine lactone efflux protein [Loktanella sp. DSM 29012]